MTEVNNLSGIDADAGQAIDGGGHLHRLATDLRLFRPLEDLLLISGQITWEQYTASRRQSIGSYPIDPEHYLDQKMMQEGAGSA